MSSSFELLSLELRFASIVSSLAMGRPSTSRQHNRKESFIRLHFRVTLFSSPFLKQPAAFKSTASWPAWLLGPRDRKRSRHAKTTHREGDSVASGARLGRKNGSRWPGEKIRRVIAICASTSMWQRIVGTSTLEAVLRTVSGRMRLCQPTQEKSLGGSQKAVRTAWSRPPALLHAGVLWHGPCSHPNSKTLHHPCDTLWRDGEKAFE